MLEIVNRYTGHVHKPTKPWVAAAVVVVIISEDIHVPWGGCSSSSGDY